eukprot:scaffold3403_cov158-Amphora_coffeaeformis.AAC.6
MGHVPRKSAELLAHLVDTNRLQIKRASIIETLDRSFRLQVEGMVEEAAVEAIEVLCPDHRKIHVGAYSLAIAKNQARRARNVSYKLQDLIALPWNPCPDWNDNQKHASFPLDHGLPPPFGPSQFQNPLTLQDIQAAQSQSWPTDDTVFLRLGLGKDNDKVWWN